MCCCRPFRSYYTSAVFGALVAGMSVTASVEDVIQMTVLPHLGGWFIRAFCVAATGVAVGGASDLSNESALAHHHLLQEDQDSV